MAIRHHHHHYHYRRHHHHYHHHHHHHPHRFHQQIFREKSSCSVLWEPKTFSFTVLFQNLRICRQYLWNLCRIFFLCWTNLGKFTQICLRHVVFPNKQTTGSMESLFLPVYKHHQTCTLWVVDELIKIVFTCNFVKNGMAFTLCVRVSDAFIVWSWYFGRMFKASFFTYYSLCHRSTHHSLLSSKHQSFRWYLCLGIWWQSFMKL